MSSQWPAPGQKNMARQGIRWESVNPARNSRICPTWARPCPIWSQARLPPRSAPLVPRRLARRSHLAVRMAGPDVDPRLSDRRLPPGRPSRHVAQTGILVPQELVPGRALRTDAHPPRRAGIAIGRCCCRHHHPVKVQRRPVQVRLEFEAGRELVHVEILSLRPSHGVRRSQRYIPAHGQTRGDGPPG